jgi:hypothetical protein
LVEVQVAARLLTPATFQVVPALEPTQTPAIQRLALARPAREIVEAKELEVVAKTTRVVEVVVRDQLDQLGLRTEEEMEETGERPPSPELESSLQAVEVAGQDGVTEVQALLKVELLVNQDLSLAMAVVTLEPRAQLVDHPLGMLQRYSQV